ncbi:MAG: sigma 54-interacting transcriptional regulator [Deltaproteobacteria bacterium]|nr:sigma 54-interacting transcriptional regulator [Deltaproteobacteria bacterium]
MNYQDLIHSPILSPGVAKLVQKCALNNAPVFIQGEQGTGKELIAKIIHHTGDWKSSLFYRVDCQILHENTLFDHLSPLFEKILFGMTPATFFLNEVGRLGRRDQLKLLELVEDGLLQNGVEKKTVKNIRFISSSSENLEEKVAQGAFSGDLYFRLRTMAIHVPPLRDRPREIGAIAQYILEESVKQLKLKRMGISNDVLRLLERYWWPGNLKELERVVTRCAILSEGEKIMEKDLSIENGMDRNSFFSFVEKAETRPAAPPKNEPSRNHSNGLNIPDASYFFLELVHRIKNPLVSIKTFTQLLRDKFNDAEFRGYFYRIVTEDIEKIDGVLNGLLNYIRINHPVEKKDTIHFIIEDVLKKHGTQIENKRIKLFRKFEKDLPETILHEEQLRYILTSLIQYAIPAIPASGSIGFLTKSLDDRPVRVENGEGQTPSSTERRYIEIMMVFTGYKKPIDPLDTLLGAPLLREEELTDLEIRLIKEMIERNRGMMKFEVNEKKLRTLVSLKFPAERRKVITYQATNSS